MTYVVPYLNLGGQCREALDFYAQALQGEISALMTFAEAPDMPKEHHDKVMHAEFRAGDVHFMASDGQPGTGDVKMGEGVSLNLMYEDEAEQTRAFDALAEGGKVAMPLQDTFWGARFGYIIDKYGIHWMSHYQKENA